MDRNLTSTPSRAVRSVLLLALVLALGLGALVSAGCSQAVNSGPTGAKPVTADNSAKMGTTASSKMSGMAMDPNAMKCAECMGKGKPTPVTGTATLENGVQVVKIKLVDGRYVPNTITAKVGTPVTVSFEGTATGCLGKPTFKSLNKSADVTKSSASIDLGTLPAGTYGFACSMGMNAGTLTVQ